MTQSLFEAFNDPANRKFHGIWQKESDISDEVAQAFNWYGRWSAKAEAARAANNADALQSCEKLTEIWSKRLVTTTAAIANYNNRLEASADSVEREFVEKGFSMTGPLRGAVADLSAEDRWDGAAIFKAMRRFEAPTP